MSVEPLVAAQIAVAAVQDMLFATAAGSLACAVMGGSPLAEAGPAIAAVLGHTSPTGG